MGSVKDIGEHLLDKHNCKIKMRVLVADICCGNFTLPYILVSNAELLR